MTDTPDDQPLTGDELLAYLVARGMSVPKAAKRIGVSERTARRRMATPEIRGLVDTFKAEAVARASGVLSREMVAAALELARLRRKSKDEKVRLTAAKELLAAAGRVRQTEDIERELAEVKERVARLTAARQKRRDDE